MRKRLLLSFTLVTAVAISLISVALSGSERATITPSPAYTDAQLNAHPGADWLSGNGNLKNQRYSTLTQINASNVATLKQAWKISLGICPARDVSCGSNEANAVVIDGIYYIPTGKGHVFAIDGATGQIIWQYTPVFDTGTPGGGL